MGHMGQPASPLPVPWGYNTNAVMSTEPARPYHPQRYSTNFASPSMPAPVPPYPYMSIGHQQQRKVETIFVPRPSTQLLPKRGHMVTRDHGLEIVDPTGGGDMSHQSPPNTPIV